MSRFTPVKTVRPSTAHRRRSRAVRSLALLPCLLASMFTHPALHAAATPVQTVARFNFAAHQTPENLAIAPDGTIYVSLAYAHQICRITPSGARTYALLPTHGGITVGVALDERAGALDVAVRSTDPAAAGIWQIDLAGFGAAGSRHRRAALPVKSFPNGLSFDARGALYIADSALGRVWRLLPGAHQVMVWSTDPLLAPNGTAFRGFPFPGANGVHAWHGAVYVSNTSTGSIVRIPILPDGSAGPAAVRYNGVKWVDDFTFDARGNLYAAEIAANELRRVSADGRQVVLATKPRDGLDNPSAVAFGVGVHDTELYITNAAYFSAQPRPSLQRLHIGITGAPAN